MSSQKLTALLDELTASRDQLAPELEGWRDFQRLNIEQPTLLVVSARIDVLTRRQEKINATIQVVIDLDGDGYPDLPPVEISPAVFSDLNNNVGTIGNAFGKVVKPEEAILATISAGSPREQV